jgi:hypothetical protein
MPSRHGSLVPAYGAIPKINRDDVEAICRSFLIDDYGKP